MKLDVPALLVTILLIVSQSAEAEDWVTIQNNEGLCLHVPRQGNLTPVQIYTCTGTEQQLWKITEKGTIINKFAARCLELPKRRQDQNGVDAQIFKCNDETNQQWIVREGRIESNSELCLGVPDSHMHKPGTRVQAFICGSGVSLEWSFF